MDRYSLDKALNKFEELTENPVLFLEYVTKQKLLDNLKLSTKEIYDFTKIEEKQPQSNNSLPKLFVQDLESEQIWQQLEIHNKKLLAISVNKISLLLAGKEKLFFKNFDKDKKNYNNSGILSDNKNNFKKGCNNLEENSENEEVNNTLFETKETTEEDTGKSGGETDDSYDGEKGNNAVTDDNFFNLSEMENFLVAEEKKLQNLNKGDHFETSESEEEGSIDIFEKDIGATEDQEGKAEMARFKDYFVAKEKPRKKSEIENSENDDLGPYDKTSSSLTVRQQRLEKKINLLEEQAVNDKPWQLKGEISAENRPQNSLLEEIVGFDLTLRPAPIITEKTSLQLEDIIRQRIKDKLFDDVERKNKHVETPLEYKKRLVLDQEKSKQSLAQIYENEYIEKQAALDSENLEKGEEVPELHKEIKSLMSNLFTKLDALSNFHFTSKPAVPELKIISHLPAISMEEVAPIAASDALLLAPEEIKNKPNGNNIGKDERSDSDKKRERRKKKQKQKIHSELKLKQNNKNSTKKNKKP